MEQPLTPERSFRSYLQAFSTPERLWTMDEGFSQKTEFPLLPLETPGCSSAIKRNLQLMDGQLFPVENRWTSGKTTGATELPRFTLTRVADLMGPFVGGGRKVVRNRIKRPLGELTWLERENLLNEWMRNRRSFNKELIPYAYKKPTNSTRICLETPAKKLKKEQPTTMSQRNPAKSRNKVRRLLMSKPECIRETDRLNEMCVPLAPLKPVLFTPEYLRIVHDLLAKIQQAAHTKYKERVQLQKTRRTRLEHAKVKKQVSGKQFAKHKRVSRRPKIGKTSPCSVELRQSNKPKNVCKTDYFPCPKCAKAFTQKSQWRRHIDCVHLNLVKYHCEVCSKGFKRSDHLKNHTRRMH